MFHLAGLMINRSPFWFYHYLLLENFALIFDSCLQNERWSDRIFCWIYPRARDAEGRVMEGTGCPGSRSDDDLVTCPLRPGPLIGPVISRDLCTGLWLVRCQLSPEAPQRWRLAHWEGRDIYFVFTTHRAGKYTNNPASLSQYLWGQSRHNWLKTKQCVVHSLNSRIFTKKNIYFQPNLRPFLDGSEVTIKYTINVDTNIVTGLPIAPKISVHLMENIRIDTSGCHPPRIIIFLTKPNWIWNFWYRDKLLKLLKFKPSKGSFDLIQNLDNRPVLLTIKWRLK